MCSHRVIKLEETNSLEEKFIINEKLQKAAEKAHINEIKNVIVANNLMPTDSANISKTSNPARTNSLKVN